MQVKIDPKALALMEKKHITTVTITYDKCSSG
jgi:hypothetical protein